MARTVFALALIGLSAVYALPAGLQDRQILGGGSTTITPGSSEGSTPCLSGASAGTNVGPCILSPAITGGVHPSSKRQGSGQDAEQAIAELQKELLALKSIPEPTDDDLAQIAALEALILYTEGISGISAPPGVNTTLTHSRKRFTLPPDATSNVNKAIDDIEKQLEALQNKRNKTDDDLEEIEDLKAALKYLAGVTQISAPPGSTTTLHPGKRFTLPPTSDVNKAIDELEKQLEALQNNPHKTDADRQEIKEIKSALLYLAGISQISAPPGSTTTLHPGKRQSSPPTIGSDACKLAEKAGVRKTLINLVLAYGSPDNAPPEVAKVMRQLISILEACGLWSSGDGGGDVTPDPTVPGGPIVPSN
jgi:chaperonin cofactor prefoldin